MAPERSQAGRRRRIARPVLIVETQERLQLGGGPLPYTLRRSSRARALRVTIHPERGVIVSVPLPAHDGWAHPEARIQAFVGAREAWIQRHLARYATDRRALDDRPPLGAGRRITFLGEPHEVKVLAAASGTRQSVVRRLASASGSLLIVEPAPGDRRTTERLLEAWFREQARAAIEAAIARHASGLGVAPTHVTLRDPRSRWGSCSRTGRLSFAWRLVLAPPEALETVVAHELCHLRVFGHGPRFRALLASRVPEHASWRRWLHLHAAQLHAALEPSPAKAGQLATA